MVDDDNKCLIHNNTDDILIQQPLRLLRKTSDKRNKEITVTVPIIFTSSTFTPVVCIAKWERRQPTCECYLPPRLVDGPPGTAASRGQLP